MEQSEREATSFSATHPRHERRAASHVYSFDTLRRNAPASESPYVKGSARSLASFMGSNARGPILNKPRHHDSALEVGAGPTASFLSRNPALLQDSRRALPGLVKTLSQTGQQTDSTEQSGVLHPLAAPSDAEEITTFDKSPQNRATVASPSKLGSASVVQQRLKSAETKRQPKDRVSVREHTRQDGTAAALSLRSEEALQQASLPFAGTIAANPLPTADTITKPHIRAVEHDKEWPLLFTGFPVLFQSERVIIGSAGHTWEWHGRNRTQAIHSASGSRIVKAGCEDNELMQALGGTLVTRLGTRRRADVFEDCLFRIQSREGNVFIDELDSRASSICSAFSYVLLQEGQPMIWNGRATLATERKAAQSFTNGLSSVSPVLLSEEGEAKIFWDALGGESIYANANHWRFRTPLTPPVTIYVGAQPSLTISETAPSIIDIFFELYIVLPDKIRTGKSLDIAKRLARTGNRPFLPPIHTISLPSLLPLDLACVLRCDVAWASSGSTEMRVASVG